MPYDMPHDVLQVWVSGVFDDHITDRRRRLQVLGAMDKGRVSWPTS